jgi:hypothetical protein
MHSEVTKNFFLLLNFLHWKLNLQNPLRQLIYVENHQNKHENPWITYMKNRYCSTHASHHGEISFFCPNQRQIPQRFPDFLLLFFSHTQGTIQNAACKRMFLPYLLYARLWLILGNPLSVMLWENGFPRAAPQHKTQTRITDWLIYLFIILGYIDQVQCYVQNVHKHTYGKT